MREIVLGKFHEVFGPEGDIRTYFAPGRVNLIGEHTDYNGGHVFPCALTVGTYAAARKRTDRKLRFYSVNFEHLGVIESSLDDMRPLADKGWTGYPKGVVWAFEKRGMKLSSGFDFVVYGDIPNGSGLSSSAAIEVLTGEAVRDLYGFENATNQDLALIGQDSENNYNGMNCGIMDQFASVFGRKGYLIRLNCHTMEYDYFPFNPQGYRLVLLNSLVKHELASSAYNDRRRSCENVYERIKRNHPNVPALSYASIEMLEEVRKDVSEEDYLCAKYVIDERMRVLLVSNALNQGYYDIVGGLMYETHRGLSQEYKVSCPELDFLNDIARECGVTGSRMMGGGFGGCTINLVKDNLYDAFIATAKEKYQEAYGKEPLVYDVVIGDGARKLL